MLAAYNPFALKNLRLLGRAGDKRPLHLYWTGSGLEMDLRARELWVELEADYADLEPWISLMVNGRLVLRQMLPKGRHWLPLLRGLDPDKPHHIYLLKESQAMPTDPDSGILVHALRFDGELAPLPEPACRLEFIGDSLTSAEGGMGGPEDSEWRPIWFAGALGYPWTAARLLGGEARVLSQSGWGTRSSWDNDPSCNLPAYYEQVCGVVPEGGLGGDHAAYDFASWKPDAVLCALGANDLGAMGNPARVDPKTGESFRQSREDTAPPPGGHDRLPGQAAPLQPRRQDLLAALRPEGTPQRAGPNRRAAPLRPHRRCALRLDRACAHGAHRRPQPSRAGSAPGPGQGPGREAPRPALGRPARRTQMAAGRKKKGS